MSEMPSAPAGIPEWDVADRLRKALRIAGIGVAEMADYLGVSRTSVSNWINGRVAPSVQTLRLWALRCGVPYFWLCDAPPPTPGRGFRSERTPYAHVRPLTFAAA
ncbi:MAG TPA: helix-turn-helix transcriptional regulator [Streptosporangiaceae bacterium]